MLANCKIQPNPFYFGLQDVFSHFYEREYCRNFHVFLPLALTKRTLFADHKSLQLIFRRSAYKGTEIDLELIMCLKIVVTVYLSRKYPERAASSAFFKSKVKRLYCK
jgi:hypothetical protein